MQDCHQRKTFSYTCTVDKIVAIKYAYLDLIMR